MSETLQQQLLELQRENGRLREITAQSGRLRLQYEDALLQLKMVHERYCEAQRIAHLGHWMFDRIGGELHWSDEIYRIFEVEPTGFTVSYEAFLSVVHPDDRQMVNTTYNDSVMNHNSYDIVHRLLMKDGRVKWVNERCVTHYGEDGTPLRSIGTVMDISQSKQSEERLRTLSSSVEQAKEAIAITDAEGVIVYVNPAFSTITGYPEQEVIGRKHNILKSGMQNDAFYAVIWQSISHGDAWQGRIMERKKDGDIYPAMLTISPIFDQNRITHYVGVQQDLSDYEALEEQFHQAQKMEAIGTLAGGIAHDFNNTLAGIVSNLYLAKKEAAELPGVVQRLGSVEALAFRAAAMIQQLLTFARKSVVNMRPVPIAAFIKEAIKLHEVSLPENIRLICSVLTGDTQINGDINQLQQVVLNLINNARDAVQDVVDPEISVRLEQFGANEAFQHRFPELNGSDFVCISVSDNGCGIRHEDIGHIFEPFYTTKPMGKGTGLGLAMVFGAVKSHAGAIEVESGMAKGTTLRIYLPALTGLIDEQNQQNPPDVVDGHGELILLVDDEQSVIETGRDVLESLNYRVLTARDGVEAVALYAQQQDAIDFVMMDVVMPRMGGIRAAGEIRRINTQAKILFVTGYDRSGLLREGEQVSGIAEDQVISKPFSVIELSHLLHEILAAGAK
ncbi:MAG: hybrid sensor histidine kinase/response regulator [Zetaproteobacteria bacterium CG_4_9_14_3_um_filter_53_7]|nr:MAG: hybrid sensor histidine kinase/response regulator [Zetaproteobacteria bacterium CG_4_9_14_3_um_filter_53_7]